ncbi:uncharacterized protein LOC124810270 [Hydra vulgaris]|uniref:uncharacterized protein LOC124810270 n=1 Tax=Hydra vulgaris TaxID=6087 RepID=UPI001F5F4B6D|nr:uncharacterized protein LOC124810270 [Hydra vulgaris]
MLSNNSALCQYQYRDSVEYTNSIFLISCYMFNAVFTVATNGFLISGLHFTTQKKKYTRNEKLVIVLSITDILNVLIVASSQTILLKQIDNIGCLEISIIIFFRVWLLGLSSSIFIIISCERYVTVFYNNKICGVIIKDSYLFGYLSFVIILTFNTAVLYSVVNVKSSLHLQYILFIGTGFVTLASLFMIVFTNLIMLIQTNKKLKSSSIRAQKNTEIKNYITKTVVIISLTHVVFYAPCLVAQYYLSFVFSKNFVSLIPAAHRVFMWTIAVREISPWINALTYTFRNRKVSKLFGFKINSLFSNNNLKVRPAQESTSDSRSTSVL